MFSAEGDFIEVDPEDGQFRESDLDLYEESGIDFGLAAKRVALYYAMLQSKDGAGRKQATEVLNEVVDEATRRLYSLHGSLGGMDAWRGYSGNTQAVID